MADSFKPARCDLYRFGPFEAYPGKAELHKFGIRVPLERKPWQLLMCLLQRPGESVGRAHLHSKLWPDGTFVDFDLGLNVAARKLRAALGDSAEDPRYIETVSGQGYRFVAEIEQVFATTATTGLAESNAEALLIERPTYLPEQAVHVAAARAMGESGFRPSDNSAAQSWLQRRKAWFAVAVLGCAASIALAIVLLRPAWRRLRQPVPDSAEKTMLVVLPFENLSGDPNQEYLSDGMTEELSARLRNLNPKRLGIIGRTSAMTYKHSPRPIGQIGKELSVSYVLEGSIRRNRKMIRVTAQLVKVSDQAHVWAETYDRNTSDLLQVEEEVAADIANQVGISMALGQLTRSNLHSPDSEAHEAYLLGRYYWYKRMPAGWSTGEQYFRRALEKDPQYASAYAGLAECRIPKQEALAAARKAVELDPTSGEARTALGWVELYRELDLTAAEGALKSAVRLDPNYAPAHHAYSGLLETTGRFEEAIREEKQAVILDPLSEIFRASLAELLSAAGQSDRGVEQLKWIFAIDPQFPKAHEALGVIYLRRGEYKEAIREFRTSNNYGGESLLGYLGYAYARSGKRDQAVRVLAELLEIEKRSGNASVDLAVVEIGLGNKDEALAWLEKTYQKGDDDGLLGLKVDPMFEPLRSDPRFLNLLRRMNFPA